MDRVNDNSRLGIASLFGFVVAAAVRDVHLGHLFGTLGLFEAAALAFGTAAALFGAGLLLLRSQQIALLARHWRTVLILNATTAIAWLSYFQALRLAESAAVNLAFSGVAPVAVGLFGALGLDSRGERRPGPAERGLHIALFGTVLLVGAIAGAGGVALAAFAGGAITAETIYAKRMNGEGVSPLAIVGARFLLVAAIAGVAAIGMDQPYAGLTASEIASQALIFLAILIGPIYLAQAGIALTTPLIAGAICALGPVATLALQSLAGGIAFTPAMLGATLLYAVLAAAAAWLSTQAVAPAAAAMPERAA